MALGLPHHTWTSESLSNTGSAKYALAPELSHNQSHDPTIIRSTKPWFPINPHWYTSKHCLFGDQKLAKISGETLGIRLSQAGRLFVGLGSGVARLCRGGEAAWRLYPFFTSGDFRSGWSSPSAPFLEVERNLPVPVIFVVNMALFHPHHGGSIWLYDGPSRQTSRKTRRHGLPWRLDDLRLTPPHFFGNSGRRMWC